nr:hypothetical protein [Kibdelosporangium sp. MJ126-NF4]
MRQRFWVLEYDRFDSATSDSALLRFLAEMLHPEVRMHLADVERLHVFLNQILSQDGYEIVPVHAISGAPVFVGQRVGRCVPSSMKNLIFAADGPKPKIVASDALNNGFVAMRATASVAPRSPDVQPWTSSSPSSSTGSSIATRVSQQAQSTRSARENDPRNATIDGSDTAQSAILASAGSADVRPNGCRGCSAETLTGTMATRQHGH